MRANTLPPASDGNASVQTSPPFYANELSPACGPSTGGTKFIIHGSGFNFSGNSQQQSTATLTSYWAHPTDLDDAKVRFMHGDKILASVAATIQNSSKIECTTVPYTRPLLHTTCESWGSVSLWISVRGSPYVQCKTPFVYYHQPFIFHMSPRAVSVAAVANNDADVSLRLTVAATPQHTQTPAQRERLALDMQRHVMHFRILPQSPSAASSSTIVAVRGTILPDDGAVDGVRASIHVPSQLSVGTYALQIAFNNTDFPPLPSDPIRANHADDDDMWTSWTSHGQFTVFSPPTLSAVSPTACFYAEGQHLTLYGQHLAPPGVTSSPRHHATAKAIVRFTHVVSSSATHATWTGGGGPYFVHASFTTDDPTTLVVKSPRFNDAGQYEVAVSVNGGVDFSALSSSLLLVYWKPTCEYVTPAYGVSMGGTDLHLRISFGQLRHEGDRPRVALEDSTFDDPNGLIRVRFMSDLLPTVRGHVSSCRKFFHCTTPKNAMVDQFRRMVVVMMCGICSHSQLEAMGLQVSVDGGVVFFDLTPKTPFSYYAPPKLRMYTPVQGPATGGTTVHLHVGVPIPDTFTCHLRFRRAKLLHQDIHDVPMTKSTDGLVLTCISPKWHLEPGETYAMALVELTLNGVDYVSDTTEFEPCGHPLFAGLGHQFCYYAPPRLTDVSAKFLSCRGHDQVVIRGAGLLECGGPIRVAFSNGTTTKYVDASRVDGDRVECRAPPFAPGTGMLLVQNVGRGQTDMRRTM
ncbi:hypothetical protein DYB38_004757 [Aphanomyces astaci]|uniref:IPT/TIG domain-containing protein n=1 Tax=Aphanomyces astaci TaxID=112090 RepID=A0A397DCG8_APHAT|nr:hypothetical protein DYB38_004757 [Aphanomyces astaci]